MTRQERFAFCWFMLSGIGFLEFRVSPDAGPLFFHIPLRSKVHTGYWLILLYGCNRITDAPPLCLCTSFISIFSIISFYQREDMSILVYLNCKCSGLFFHYFDNVPLDSTSANYWLSGEKVALFHGDKACIVLFAFNLCIFSVWKKYCVIYGLYIFENIAKQNCISNTILYLT